jgi:hypothetical protein
LHYRCIVRAPSSLYSHSHPSCAHFHHITIESPSAIIPTPSEYLAGFTYTSGVCYGDGETQSPRCMARGPSKGPTSRFGPAREMLWMRLCGDRRLELSTVTALIVDCVRIQDARGRTHTRHKRGTQIYRKRRPKFISLHVKMPSR